MGKKHGYNEKTERYERKNYDHLLDKKPDEQTEKRTNRKYQTNQQENDTPVLRASVWEVLNILEHGISEFVGMQQKLDDSTIEDRRKSENNLFNLRTWPYVSQYNDQTKYYVVNRLVKTDRNTHKLMRATVTIVGMDVDTATPKYTIDAYLTSTLNGSIVLIQMGDRGPVKRWSTIYNIKDGEVLGLHNAETSAEE